jgi:hypothetical protein
MGKRLWIVDGRKADNPVLAQLLAAAREEKLKRSVAVRAEKAADFVRENDLKKVGAAIRKAVREQEREARRHIRVIVKPEPSRGLSERESRRFDAMVGLKKRRAGKRSKDGLYSFHCRFTSRGIGERRLNKGRVYRRGEIVKHVRYILRAAARELSQGGVVSNVSLDPDELAGVFAALEELEHQDRANSNVYMSLVISLPHELSPEERERVLGEICESFAEHGLPYVGVLHAPDPDGDQRNFHAHIMFSLRPIEVDGPGRYAFAAEKYSDLNDESFIKPFRMRVAEILNAAMAREGNERRFTGLSDADRGLTPRKKGSGKNSIGYNHRLRKQEDLKLMQAERDLRRRYGRVLQRTRSVITQIAQEKPRAFAQEVALRYGRLQGSLARIKSEIGLGSTQRSADLASRRAQLEATQARVARAQPPSWVSHVPDHTRYPGRAAALFEAAENLRAMDYVPLVKMGERFAIHHRHSSRASLLQIDSFEADKGIQTLHAQKWQSMLTALRDVMDHSPRCPLVVKDAKVQMKAGVLSGALDMAYHAATPHPDVLALLDYGWDLWEGKRKAKDAKQAAILAAIDKVAAAQGQRIVELAAPADKDDRDIQVRILTRKVKSGEIAMRFDGNRPVFFLADEADGHWVRAMLSANGGRAFVIAIGKAGMEVEFDFKKVKARIELPAPPSRPSRGPAEAERGAARPSRDGQER